MQQKNDECYMRVNMLGNIYIKHMIVYYDQPLIYTCVNDFNNNFIANCTEMDGEKKIWIFLPISEARLVKGLRGNISGYDLFKDPEGDFLWEVTQTKISEIAIANQISPNIINDDDLPEKDVYFNVLEDELLNNYDNRTLNESITEQREIIDISLEPNSSHSHEIECESFSKIIKDVQQLVYLIAYKNGTRSNNIPENIKRDNKLIISGTYAASFGVRLKSELFADIFGYSKLQENIKIFMDLLESKNDVEKVRNIIKNLNPYVGVTYSNLLKKLSKSNIAFKTNCAFPNNYYKSIQLNEKEIKSCISSIDSEIMNKASVIELFGELVGANVSAKKFSFITVDNDNINGSIGENIDVDEYRLPTKAKIKVEARIEANKFTKREMIKYKLLELKYLEKEGSFNSLNYEMKIELEKEKDEKPLLS